MEPYIMKSHKVLFLALIVSVSLAISAQAGDRHGNNDNSQRGPARGRGSAPAGTGGSNRTVGNISPGHNHVFAQRSADWNRNWDRRRDHFWNGHRCRFVNGSWFIFDIGFFPWFGWPFYDYYAYDYYPYGHPYVYGDPSGHCHD